MQINNALQEDLSELKQMWQEIFQDTEEFCTFAFSLCDLKDIFVLKEGDNIAAMLMAGIDVTAYGKNGYYIYGVATKPEHRKKGYAKALINHVLKEKISQGYDFVITQPASDSLYAFYDSLGFTAKTYLRVFDMDIKKNLWATADFDTVTATRFYEAREKFKEDEIVHFTPKTYEKFTEYIYKTGGSTAESKGAFAVYFMEKGTLIIRELSAKSTTHAVEIVQAIRERTGLEKARIELSQGSSLFVGEGKLQPHCAVIGLEKEVYANMMFD